MPWHLLLGMAVTKLNLSPSEFWQLTFPEFYAIYNYAAGKDKPMSVTDAVLLEEMWANGNT